MKYRCAGEVGAFGAIFYTAFGGENHTTALAGEGNAIPLWWLAPPPSPHFVVGLWMLSHVVMSLQESIETYSAPLNRGKSGAAGKGVASVASQSAECLSYHMT